ncbi:MAG TPA: hypothetical protein VHK69_02660 [Chitinophagaceae bacterium]|nr:hypothetical protein [Chitinophagaceae bacterium]
MYATLITVHSLFRWLVLLSLLYALFRAGSGYRRQRSFSRQDNAVRHWTATIAHIQLMIGILLYTQSPVVSAFWKNGSGGYVDGIFFAWIHLALMLGAIVLVTVGSALAKRKASDREKFRVLLVWFAIALLLILIAIPWPFSPLAARPYLRIV